MISHIDKPQPLVVQFFFFSPQLVIWRGCLRRWYSGCHWILNFTHNAFPCYTIHGNGLGIVETESGVFQVLLDLLGPCLLWRRSLQPVQLRITKYTNGSEHTQLVTLEYPKNFIFRLWGSVLPSFLPPFRQVHTQQF